MNAQSRKPWSGVITKPNGTDVLFSLFERQYEAELACARLVSFGMAARIHRIRTPGAAPGDTLHLSQRAKAAPAR